MLDMSHGSDAVASAYVPSSWVSLLCKGVRLHIKMMVRVLKTCQQPPCELPLTSPFSFFHNYYFIIIHFLDLPPWSDLYLLFSPPFLCCFNHRFVLQYYSMMNENPSKLYHFYSEDSHFCHTEDPSGRADVVHGLDGIRKRVGELNFDNNTNIDLSDGAYDVQESFSNPSASSIIVVVTGHFSKKDTSPSPFTHTFMLAKLAVRFVFELPHFHAWCDTQQFSNLSFLLSVS